MIARAVELLHQGKLVAFPTETVYGLGVDATNADAILRIFAAKGRPSTNPLICHVADESMARRYAITWPDKASALARAFWPGPITIVLPKQPIIPMEATAGRDTVGLRAPNHPLTLELLRAFGKPIAGPSANKSNHISPTTAQHVRDELGEAVDLILDGGPCHVGIESTVLDLSSHRPRILRPGSVTAAQIEAVLGEPVEFKQGAGDTEIARSPGQMHRHYAPRKPLVIIAARCATADQTLLITGQKARSAAEDSLDSKRHAYISCGCRICPLPAEPREYAHKLYDLLRELDDDPEVVSIEVQAVPDTPEWAAIRDRLQRASTPKS